MSQKIMKSQHRCCLSKAASELGVHYFLRHKKLSFAGKKEIFYNIKITM